MNVTLVKAGQKDAQLILAGQREAFLPMLERYNAGDMDPANEKIENIQKAIEREYFYKILADGTFAGAMMIEKEGELHLKLHTLYVKPDMQNKGIGGRAIDIAEKLHADAVEWTLNTPADQENNRHLYEKKGYVKRGERKINDALTLIYYSKAGSGAPVFIAAQSRDPKQSETIELKKGQRFKVGEEYQGPEGWDGWFYCTADTNRGWVQESFIERQGEGGIAKEDYSSFELMIEQGEKLRCLRETGGWALCENSRGGRGWVPMECLRAAER